MHLSIIIVNYNVQYFLEQALLSVRKAAEGIAAEVFVVDNNSVDNSAAMVREKFPEVKLIVNTRNTGFAVANNQAIRESTGKYVLLLNPDTVVREDTFSRCLDFMDAHPGAGALGVKMIDGSGKFLPESKRGFPTPFVAFAKTFGLSAFFPKSKLFNRYHLGYLDENETHEVDVLAGAFMLMRREALDKAGWQPTDIDYIITVSCTGIMIPSVDAYLVNSLKMKQGIVRLPVTEMGCAAGISGIIYASNFLAANPGKRAAVVAVVRLGGDRRPHPGRTGPGADHARLR